MGYLDDFIHDVEYYDLENKEIEAIVKNIDLKGKTLIDVGCGVGRLSLSLLKHAKKVRGLDIDKRLINYCKKKNKSKNLIFINKDIKDFIKSTKEKFDVILIAWPVFDNKIIMNIDKLMHENSKLIFISCHNDSDFETIPDKIEPKKDFKEDITNKERLIKYLKDNFNQTMNKDIDVYYTYPNEKIAFDILTRTFKIWFDIKINNKKKKTKLMKIINQYKKDGKVIIPEKIMFYVFEIK